jgi:hypothetical protein
VKAPKRDGGKWLACIWQIGSNYVEVRSPKSERGYSHQRVHFDDFHKLLTHEPDAARIIAENVARQQTKLRGLLEEIRELAARLGFQPVRMIGETPDPGTALAVLSNTSDPKAYSKALVKAKKTTLPELQKKIEEESGELNRWLLAGTMGMRIEQKRLMSSLGSIDERIFNIELYAGLTEEVEKIADGEPAEAHEKIRVLQRRLYMDEECLLNYKAGGMVFNKIGEFDAWIAMPENRDRILPWPRCVVSFRVRRRKKERFSATMTEAFINFKLEKADESTFLYIRNGGQLWRLSCEQDFGSMLFPDRALFESGRSMMMKVDYRKVDGFMDKAEFDVLLAKYNAGKAAFKKWEKDNPPPKGESEWSHEHKNPHRGYEYPDGYGSSIGRFEPDDWVPFDPSSVYFDDATQKMTDEIKAYNRIVLVLQGLLDRSETLHPHPPINLWNAEHMERHVELVSDAAGVLHHGDKPDFEAYRAKLNAMITTDCVLVGQQDFWQEKMAERENERDRHRSRGRSYPLKRYTPYGNKGPEEPSKPAAVSARGKTATFRWLRERLTYDPYSDKTGGIPQSVTVPFSRLLNVSAYQAGDYLQFFRDHRTRQEYLQWAPYLLAAEDHVAGKTPPTDWSEAW